jgi:hypothetical protein
VPSRLRTDAKAGANLGIPVKQSLAIFAVGAVGVLCFAVCVFKGVTWQGCEMVAIARSVAEHGVFGNPFLTVATGPTATEPPLYPLALALAFKILKSPAAVSLLATIAAIAATIAVAASLPALSREFFHSPTPGMIGGVFCVLSTAPLPGWEANWTQFGLVLLVLATVWLLRSPERLIWRGTAAGASAGLISLLNPASALISFPCVVYLVIRRRVSFRGSVRFLAAFVFAAALMNLPWLVRNYALWGRPVLRTNFGMTFYSSNNDCAVPSMVVMLLNGCYASTHPNQNLNEALYLRRIGEVAYDRERTADAFAWIRLHPARFAWLTRHRMVEFWLPVPGMPAGVYYMVWAITLLSIPGLVWMLCKREAALALFLAVFLLYPSLYYVVVSDLRYRMPMLWLSCLAAGYFVWRLRETLRSPGRRAVADSVVVPALR